MAKPVAAMEMCKEERRHECDHQRALEKKLSMETFHGTLMIVLQTGTQTCKLVESTAEPTQETSVDALQ
jgi:hypothetical protein